MNSKADYAHRLMDDGTFDSICLHRFHTVTTAHNEPELVFGEAQHRCRQIRPCILKVSSGFYIN